ncbi:MAG: hypothetical protein A3F84_23040 [Candidatus Handelsmanbacteria bacterium RIFCSPLOWO2_12_FULL_64_10]|uniref:Glycosyltransferase subfamily 4-like N-terminal domain-containing protein n=1 Tax=Handelsmanbacteria sp. (strain RIFCSPLOWO2_12_FULL_64_10) TaxID=1817868 RepID=A0A1F6CG41_HANXR|nr:MAG: hypothetical protein A3F84_23040 [Candidatus Handelsmanbacteria bacterium RIFCSPLOWO2_12_FULL_64_10]
MRRLLAVSWAMPPILSPRSIQVQRSLHYLAAEHGWQVTALAVAPERAGRGWELDPGLESLYPAQYQVQRIPPLEGAWPLWLLGHVFPSLAQLPDPQRSWAWRAGRLATRLCDRQAFSALITFGQPMSDHLVGLRIRRRHPLPWVAHFSDPWCDNPYTKWASAWTKRWNLALERRVVAGSDRLVFVNAVARDLVMRKYPAGWGDKAVVIPQGYDRGLTPAAKTPGSRPRLTLCYTGSFYGSRSPLSLLEAIQRLGAQVRRHLRVILAGPIWSEYRRVLTTAASAEVVQVVGTVPYSEVVGLLNEADCLLLIDAVSEGKSPFLSSKLIDYLAFQKPILGLTPPEGASADLLRRLGCRVVAPDDVQGIAGALSDLIGEWQNGRLRVSPQFEKAAGEYDIRQTTRRLAAVLGLVARR